MPYYFALLLLSLVLLVELLLLIISVSYLLFLFWGAPYVPSRPKHASLILRELNLKQNKTFLDLGCGDGYIVRQAVKKYKVKGVGVDINPVLIFYAKLAARLAGMRAWANFKNQNVFRAEIGSADYIYLYLLPTLLKKLTAKLERETKPGAIIISNSFQIKGWEKRLYKTIPLGKNSAYFYKIKHV